MPEEPRNRLTEPVPWSIFAWAVGICSVLFLAMFGLYSAVDAKVERAAGQQQEILVQLSQIQADLKNLEYLIKSKP